MFVPLNVCTSQCLLFVPLDACPSCLSKLMFFPVQWLFKPMFVPSIVYPFQCLSHSIFERLSVFPLCLCVSLTLCLSYFFFAQWNFIFVLFYVCPNQCLSHLVFISHDICPNQFVSLSVCSSHSQPVFFTLDVCPFCCLLHLEFVLLNVCSTHCLSHSIFVEVNVCPT